MNNTNTPGSKLVDGFGRHVNYVRLSVTDRCDFRCVYCMSEQMQFLPRSQVLSLEEIALLARAFTQLGVNKIRITGGEPLVRRNIVELFQDLGGLPGLDDLTLTTNGSQLGKLAEPLRQAGVRRINISLDSLDPQRFRAITRVGDLAQVLEGIEAARQAGFERIKINTVAMKQRNDDEIVDLVHFVIERGLDISFIEEMPLGDTSAHDRAELFMSSAEVRECLAKHFTLSSTDERTGGPSRYYRIAGQTSRIGFISPHSHNFCDTCNRVRVTTEGRLLLCLGQEHSMDLKQVLRSFPGEIEPLKTAMMQAMALKPQGHEFEVGAKPLIFRHMSVTGG